MAPGPRSNYGWRAGPWFPVTLLVVGLLLALLVALLFAKPTRAAVLDIGDSHTWLAETTQSFPGWEVDAVPGRASTEGLAVMAERLRTRDSEVIFDLGTNDRGDPKQFAANLRQVWSLLVPGSELTLVSVFVPASPGTGSEVNQVIHDFAARHPQRVDVARWSRLAAVTPAYWGSDGIHFNADGYQARRDLIRDTMRR
jgi:hypothetical protein